MTEGEAKTKWCPHRRLTEIGNVRVTNIDPGIRTLNCIGADCMMWRTESEQMVFTGKQVAVEVTSGFMRVVAEQRPQLIGHCGLAGKR